MIISKPACVLHAFILILTFHVILSYKQSIYKELASAVNAASNNKKNESKVNKEASDWKEHKNPTHEFSH